MPSSNSSRDALLERLAEEFVERHRRGEHPALSEYVKRHPDLAAEIRELFPALVQIEKLKPAAGDLTGEFFPASTSSEEHIPERFGEYRILRQVGQGGMGIVYEAEQESLGRHVALKVLPRQALLKTTYRERFRREAKAAGRLHHTNIVPVFGVGEHDGTHYYVMQFIAGEGLDKVLRDLRHLRAVPGGDTVTANPAEASVAHSLLTGRFVVAPPTSAATPAAHPTPSIPSSADRTHGSSTLSMGGSESQYSRGVARLALQVADALAYAHRQGILHRDIKPSNLLLDQQGTVWITDFGLAKAEGADDLTQTGDIVGTVRYMAPERFDGRSLPQSDVYALGITMYELLTLRPAFDDGNKARLVEKVLHDPPVPPRKLDPHIPRDLETVVLKCLAKDPEERYPSAEAVAEDVRRFLADRPILARRSSWPERLRRWVHRNPALAFLSTAVAALLALVAAVSTTAFIQTRGALDSETQARTAATRGQAEALRERDNANRYLYASLIGQARALRVARVEGYRYRAWELLGQAQQLDAADRDLAALRLEAVACLGDFVGREPAARQKLPAAAWRFALRPDGRRLAVVLGDGQVLLRDLDTGADVARLGNGRPPVSCLTFAPDGQALLTGHSDGTVNLWRPGGAGGWSARHLARLAAPAFAIRWTPLGRRLVCALFEDRAIVRDLDAPSPTSLKAGTNALEGEAVFSADGEVLAVACRRAGGGEGLLVWEVATGKPHGFAASGLGAVQTLDLSPNGSRVACACTEGVAVFDTTDLRRVWFVRCDEPSGVAFGPDGRTLALCASQDDTVRLWNLTGNRERAVLRLPGGARALAFDAAGRTLLAVGPRALQAWALWTKERLALAGHDSGVEGMTFSPDGRLLVSPSIDRTVKVWNPTTGALLRTLRGFAGTTRVAAFSADGRILAVGSADRHALVRFWDVATWKEQSLLGDRLDWVDRSHAPQVWVVAFRVDGDTLAVGGDGVGLTLWQRDRPAGGGPGGAAGAPFRQRQRLWGGSVTAAQFSPDGKHLAWVDRQARLHVYDLHTRRLLPRPSPSLAWHVRSIAFSPDSGEIIYLDGMTRDLRRWRLNDGDLQAVAPNARFERSRGATSNGLLAMSRDGAWAALSGRAVSVWDVARHELLLALPEEQTAVYCLTWSPDRRRLAVGTSDGTLSIWDIPAMRARLAEIALDW